MDDAAKKWAGCSEDAKALYDDVNSLHAKTGGLSAEILIPLIQSYLDAELERAAGECDFLVNQLRARYGKLITDEQLKWCEKYKIAAARIRALKKGN